jgi:hypothetical protein
LQTDWTAHSKDKEKIKKVSNIEIGNFTTFEDHSYKSSWLCNLCKLQSKAQGYSTFLSVIYKCS